MKIDIENSELACYKQWIKSNVMSYVDQLGKYFNVQGEKSKKVRP